VIFILVLNWIVLILQKIIFSFFFFIIGFKLGIKVYVGN